MQSRMDKYNTNTTVLKSRSEKNKDLYENVRNSSLTDFDVNSNVEVIGKRSDIIKVSDVKQLLDDKYSDTPRRRSIEIPDIPENIVQEEIMDTKEYDINAILSKAKQGKNVDYAKERRKFIRDAQYEILNNLDLELKNVEEYDGKKKDPKAEEDLMNLINTITHIEKINKEKNYKNITDALDLLGLGDNEEKTESDNTQDNNQDNNDVTLELEAEAKQEEPITETLSKLEIDMSSYDDFKDISKRDRSSVVIKIIVFIVVLILILGALYILNNVLGLGLFNIK